LPAHRLSEAKGAEISRLCIDLRFANLLQSQIVPRPVDGKVHLASESSFYPVLHAAARCLGKPTAPER